MENYIVDKLWRATTCKIFRCHGWSKMATPFNIFSVW